MPDPRWPERVFRALLRMFPSEFRGDFGDQMADDFRDQHRDASTRGGRTRRWRLWVRTLADVLQRAPREHVDVLRRDAGYALRQLRRRPGVSAGAIATLAMGLGLNTAVFSLASTVMWRTLPLPEGERLVAIHEISTDSRNTDTRVSALNFLDWETQSRTLDGLAIVGWRALTLVGPGEPEHLIGATITRGFFRIVPVRPALGRLFTDGDYEPLVRARKAAASRSEDAPPIEAGVVIISHTLWLRTFNGRDDAIGTRVRLGQTPVEIVGVLPEVFVFPGSEKADFWQPALTDDTVRRARSAMAFGRLAAGTSLAEAQSEFDVISARLASQYPRANKDYRARLVNLREEVATKVRGHVWLLLGAAGSVLLIACASIGNLLMAQASGRRLEFATRAALGATRAYLVRQTLTEALVFAALGGIVGAFLAFWALPVLVSYAPPEIPRLSEIALDRRVLIFTAAASIAVGLVCGGVACIAPARLYNQPIRQAAGADRRAYGRRFRLGLTVAQVALALTLVIGTGLLIRTLRAVASLDLGFIPTNVLSVGLTPQSERYPTPAAKLHFETDLVERVREMPGVIAAGIGTRPLGEGTFATEVNVPAAPDKRLTVSLDVVGPGYLEALGGHLASGRFFVDADTADRPLVAVVNQAAARALWPGVNPLGQIVVRDNDRLQVVGVVGDVRRMDLEADPAPTLYTATAQMPRFWTNNLLIRTSGDARAVLPAVRDVMRAIDREQALTRIQTMEERMREATAPRRQLLSLVGLFSIMALVLALVGVYGVVAEHVAQRVPEIGVRMALGATTSEVMRLVLRQGAQIGSAGIVLGLAIAIALNRVMAGFVFRVGTMDPATYAVACLSIAAATVAACALPAKRAAAVDPVIALRQE